MIETVFATVNLTDLIRPAFKPRTFYYLATPYARYCDGRRRAFEEACQYAGILIQAGVNVFCPIAHSHPIAKHCRMDQTSHDTWMPNDLALVRASSGVLIAPMAGWRLSKGVAMEVSLASSLNLPINMLDAHY